MANLQSIVVELTGGGPMDGPFSATGLLPLLNIPVDANIVDYNGKQGVSAEEFTALKAQGYSIGNDQRTIAIYKQVGGSSSLKYEFVRVKLIDEE